MKNAQNMAHSELAARDTRFKAGVSPLAWTNDVLEDLGGDILLEVCLREARRAGMFTVPGDGRVDFKPLARFVRDSGYAGWLVVEAEQGPKKAQPLATVSRARRFVAEMFEAA